MSWVIWAAVILLLSQMMGGESASLLSLKADGLVFESTSGLSSAVSWTEIRSVEVRQAADYGAVVQGTDNSKEKSGIWKNAEFGEYELFVNPGIKTCIVCFTNADQVIVFNFESADSTMSLYEVIVRKMNME